MYLIFWTFFYLQKILLLKVPFPSPVDCLGNGVGGKDGQIQVIKKRPVVKYTRAIVLARVMRKKRRVVIVIITILLLPFQVNKQSQQDNFYHPNNLSKDIQRRTFLQFILIWIISSPKLTRYRKMQAFQRSYWQSYIVSFIPIPSLYFVKRIFKPMWMRLLHFARIYNSLPPRKRVYHLQWKIRTNNPKLEKHPVGFFLVL